MAAFADMLSKSAYAAQTFLRHEHREQPDHGEQVISLQVVTRSSSLLMEQS